MRPSLRHLCRWACMVEADGGAAAGPRMQAVCLHALPAPGRDALPADPLVAQRRREAAALPWLAGSQAQDVPGDWLVCAEAVAPLQGELYRRSFLRLPVGRDDSVGPSRWPVAPGY